MAEILRSVGLDVGTTSTQLIFSELEVDSLRSPDTANAAVDTWGGLAPAASLLEPQFSHLYSGRQSQ